jgi:hypothetical protein
VPSLAVAAENQNLVRSPLGGSGSQIANVVVEPFPLRLLVPRTEACVCGIGSVDQTKILRRLPLRDVSRVSSKLDAAIHSQNLKNLYFLHLARNVPFDWCT